ncbi:MAG: transposase [Rhodoferax sp.]|nr:transposase [Rhodoferax sp.]
MRQQQANRCSMRCTNGWALQRQKVPDGSATAKALISSLRRWVAPSTRFVDDGQLPADNN